MYSLYILYFTCVTQIYMLIIGIIIGYLDKGQIVSIKLKVHQKDSDISLELIILIARHLWITNIFVWRRNISQYFLYSIMIVSEFFIVILKMYPALLQLQKNSISKPLLFMKFVLTLINCFLLNQWIVKQRKSTLNSNMPNFFLANDN